MSQLVHPHPVVAARRHPRISWLVVALVVGAVALSVTIFAIAGEDEDDSPLPSVSTLTVDGVRYDGGPEEGTAGVSSLHITPGIRYDGGPEEGTAGVSSLSSQTAGPAARYDGGPNEGSADITR